MHSMWRLQPNASHYPQWIGMTNTGLLFARRCWSLCDFTWVTSAFLSSLSILLHRVNCVQHLPANQAEPREAVVKGVPSGHHIFTVFRGIVGYISGAIVHLSHEIEPLPARSSNDCLIKSRNKHSEEWRRNVRPVDTVLFMKCIPS